jgi:hypothetical protein
MFGRGRKHGTATVVARKYDTEATSWVGSSPYVYVLDVAPEDGGAPFRVEAHITLPDTVDILAPDTGDAARVTYDPNKPDHVKFDLDAHLSATAATRKASDDAFAALAQAPPGSGPLGGQGPKPLDAELQELMDEEERERGDAR